MLGYSQDLVQFTSALHQEVQKKKKDREDLQRNRSLVMLASMQRDGRLVRSSLWAAELRETPTMGIVGAILEQLKGAG